HIIVEDRRIADLGMRRQNPVQPKPEPFYCSEHWTALLPALSSLTPHRPPLARLPFCHFPFHHFPVPTDRRALTDISNHADLRSSNAMRLKAKYQVAGLATVVSVEATLKRSFQPPWLLQGPSF
ncbi:hypothetical protein SMD27_23975, partial [Dongia soli]